MNSKIKNLVESVKDDVIRWRRNFHQNPELSFNEVKTVAYIKKELSVLPNISISNLTPTSLQVLIKGATAGKRIAIRADIDALPIEENSGEEFSSKNSGVMHACGHDSHTAILMGAVKIASGLADKIKGELLFIFQHAEELPPGGAIDLVNAGVLDKVDMIFGIHADPSFATGTVGYHNGVFSASSDNFYINIKGKGVHGSMPQKGIDPIVVGAEIVNALQTIVSRKMDPLKCPVITVATFKSEGGFNIIPETAYLAGTIRTHDKVLREEIPKLIDKTVKGICDIFDAGYEFKVIRGYPVGVNNREAIAQVSAAFEEFLAEGAQLNVIENPMFGGEDFAFYQEKVRGCFMFYGSGSKKMDCGMLHSPKFKLDESAMQVGLSMHVALIFHLLIS